MKRSELLKMALTHLIIGLLVLGILIRKDPDLLERRFRMKEK
jgi:hypothetical protein